MNIVQLTAFAVVLACAAPAHAQVCSGGPDGGADATGNQCNTPGDVAAISVPPGAAPPRSVPNPDRRQQHGPPVVRFHSSWALAKASKHASGPPSACSGGVDGGMDATGNQCQ
jgi:hypothetical protein